MIKPIQNAFGIRGHPMNPPIAWVGGKRSILQEILCRFPLEFDRYIEVFGGSGVVLFGNTAGGGLLPGVQRQRGSAGILCQR